MLLLLFPSPPPTELLPEEKGKNMEMERSILTSCPLESGMKGMAFSDSMMSQLSLKRSSKVLWMQHSQVYSCWMWPSEIFKLHFKILYRFAMLINFNTSKRTLMY